MVRLTLFQASGLTLALFGTATACHDEEALGPALKVASADDVARTRASLIDFVWGAPGFPAGDRMPSAVVKGVKSPVVELTNLKRVDNLVVKMEAGEDTVAHHFIASQASGRLVIVHQGHACTLNDPYDTGGYEYGLGRAIRELLAAGHSVLGMYMPHLNPGQCEDIPSGSATCNRLFATLLPQAGSVMKFYLEPITVALNYLRTGSAADDFPAYTEYDMVGLSGGGWTTTVYAALDPAIKVSIPVAGSVPLYMQRCVWGTSSPCDAEQMLPGFYAIAGYQELYALGSSGAGRRQVQVLNRRDNCCYGERDFVGPGNSWNKALRDYERKVQPVAAALGGSYVLRIDEAATQHEISAAALDGIILPELAAGPSQ